MLSLIDGSCRSTDDDEDGLFCLVVREWVGKCGCWLGTMGWGNLPCGNGIPEDMLWFQGKMTSRHLLCTHPVNHVCLWVMLQRKDCRRIEWVREVVTTTPVALRLENML